VADSESSLPWIKQSAVATAAPKPGKSQASTEVPRPNTDASVANAYEQPRPPDAEAAGRLPGIGREPCAILSDKSFREILLDLQNGINWLEQAGKMESDEVGATFKRA